jgi:predicted glycosyltransferase
LSRILLVSPPWEGHINPAAGLAAVIRSLGHDVAWAGDGAVLRRLGVVDHVFETPPSPAVPDRPSAIRGLAALQFLWSQCMAPLACHMDATVTRAIAQFNPDAVIVDQQAVGAALRTYDAGLPWLTLACSPAELVTRSGAHASILDWTRAAVSELAHALGIQRRPDDALFSPQGTLMPSAHALMGNVPGHLRVHALGCLVKHRQGCAPPQTPAVARPHVLVSLGTVSSAAGRRFLNAAWDAATAGAEVCWTIVDPARTLGQRHADNVTLATRVDQLALLAHTHVVLCHGGHNTVAEALLHGIPLVVAPIRDDQPVIAQHVVDAGAGLRLRFAHASAEHIADTVGRVLTEPLFRHAAARVSEELTDGEDRARSLLARWLDKPTAALG